MLARARGTSARWNTGAGECGGSPRSLQFAVELKPGRKKLRPVSPISLASLSLAFSLRRAASSASFSASDCSTATSTFFSSARTQLRIVGVLMPMTASTARSAAALDDAPSASYSTYKAHRPLTGLLVVGADSHDVPPALHHALSPTQAGLQGPSQLSEFLQPRGQALTNAVDHPAHELLTLRF